MRAHTGLASLMGGLRGKYANFEFSAISDVDGLGAVIHVSHKVQGALTGTPLGSVTFQWGSDGGTINHQFHISAVSAKGLADLVLLIDGIPVLTHVAAQVVVLRR